MTLSACLLAKLKSEDYEMSPYYSIRYRTAHKSQTATLLDQRFVKIST